MTQQTIVLTRRTVLKSAAAFAAGSWVAPLSQAQPSRSANATLRFACIGVGGKGKSNTDYAGRQGHVTDLCDIDSERLKPMAAKYSSARTATDFREVLDRNRDFDAVVISTPDHTHAAIALLAMRHGKHVYCEKPLCKYVQEARICAEVAREKGVVTQMGNQGTAKNTCRQSVEAIRAGVVGEVREVHVWTNRPVWPTGPGTHPEKEPCPASISWQDWIGPAEDVPYSPSLHPFKWRAWWPFGTGALGDMGSHQLNGAFHACDLRDPVSVTPIDAEHDGITYPKASTIRWDFPVTPRRGPVTLHWYDGGRKPTASFAADSKLRSGCAIVGSEGVFLSESDYNSQWTRIPTTGTTVKPQEVLPRAREENHFTEFVEAIRGNGACLSNFADVAAPLTETLMLGNLALMAKERIQWDAKQMQVVGRSDLDQYIRPQYRAGYTL